jgi:hypothetical protein
LSADGFRGLAEEQAALRRVAWLVARGAAPEEVFAAVTGLTGLGDRIEALGGTLHITSPPGADTTLLIQIPAARPAIPAPSEP